MGTLTDPLTIGHKHRVYQRNNNKPSCYCVIANCIYLFIVSNRTLLLMAFCYDARLPYNHYAASFLGTQGCVWGEL